MAEKKIEKRSKVRTKEYMSITLDKGLKEKIVKNHPNVSAFVTSAIVKCLGICPACGKHK